MLYTADAVWYAPLNIHYSVGVDGISVAMLLLSSIIVFTGVLASWKMAVMPREYFAWFSLLSIGVFGFFISIDLFTMFLFYEVALIPMYLLIGVWGTGRKEYSAMKLTLMLMGGSALLLVGILGIYFHSAPEGGQLSMNILEISKHTIPMSAQYLFFPLTFVGFGVLGAMFPFHTWSPDGHASAPTAVSMLHAGVLMKLGGYGCFRVAIFLMPEAANELSWIFLILTARASSTARFRPLSDRSEIYQRLLVGEPLRPGVVRYPDAEPNGDDRRRTADAVARPDDGSVLRADRYDLRSHAHPRHPRDGRPDAGDAVSGRLLRDRRTGVAGPAGSQRLRGRDDRLRRIVRAYRHFPPILHDSGYDVDRHHGPSMCCAWWASCFTARCRIPST